VSSRYAVGSTPNSARKAREKWLRLANPTAAAIDFTSMEEFRSSLAAVRRRTDWR
jgi:hypothetical protein